MVIARKLRRAERKFRTVRIKVRKFRIVRIKVRKFSHRAKHPHSTRVAFCTTQTNFHRGRNNLQKFFLQRNNFQKWGNLQNNFRKGESTCENPSKLRKSKIQIRMATVPGVKWFRKVQTTPSTTRVPSPHVAKRIGTVRIRVRKSKHGAKILRLEI